MPSRRQGRGTDAVFIGETSSEETSLGRQRRQAHDEAGADDVAIRPAAVLGRQGAAVRIDDLAGDAQAEARLRAELLAGRPLAVDALEDGLFLAGRAAGALVLDRDGDHAAGTAPAQGDPAAGRAERDSVAEQVGGSLDGAGRPEEGRGGREWG